MMRRMSLKQLRINERPPFDRQKVFAAVSESNVRMGMLTRPQRKALGRAARAMSIFREGNIDVGLK